jgi:hypothetical protein
MSKNIKRVAAILALAGMLGIGVVRPAPVMGIDTEEGLLWAGVALAGYLTIVFVGTTIVYGHDSKAVAASQVDWQQQGAPSNTGLRLANRCTQGSGSVTLACW